MLLRNRKSRLHIGCLLAILVFSAYLAIVTYPSGAWKFGAAFGSLAFASIFLRVGWFVPFAIAGAFLGMSLDAQPKGGTVESQMQETVKSILGGTICGFVIGAMIDLRHKPTSPLRNAEEPSDRL